MVHLAALSCLLALAAGDPSSAGADRHHHRPVVHVPGLGRLRGIISERSSEVVNFRAVPYARAPIGDLRWRPPVAFGAWGRPWSRARDASAFADSCIPYFVSPNVSVSEDCLFLNVATPTSALRRTRGDGQHDERTLLPAMVYIHGGAYRSGTPSVGHPDAIVAGTGGAAVVVTPSYRLNIYGFLGADALRGRDKDGSTGNYGIQDQRMALTWVRDHIGAFGGDGSSVTVWGESAGGNAVLNHLVQPASFGLYSRAIIESGTYASAHEMDVANRQYDEFLDATSCSDIDCLTQLSVEDIDAFLQKHSSGWEPTIDGVSLNDFPQAIVGHGKHNKNVPVLIGTNRDEEALFLVGTVPKQFPKVAFEAGILATPYAANESELLDLYKFNGSYPYPSDLGGYSVWFWESMRMSTDGGGSARRGQPSMGLGHCSARCVAKGLVAGGTPNVFFYHFQHPSNETILDFNEGTPMAGTGINSPFAPHASELPYVFSMFDELDSGNGEHELAQAMSAYWTKFAELGDPNRGGLPAWPSWEPGTDLTQSLDVGAGGIGPLGHHRSDACDFFDLQPHSVCMPLPSPQLQV